MVILILIFKTLAVGKISRRVSLVHFPESDELRERNSKNAGQMYQSSAGISFTKSSYQPATSTPSSFLRNSRSTHSSRHKSSLIEVGEHSNPSRNQRSSSGRSTTTYGSRHKSSVSEVGEPSKSASKGKDGQRSSSINQSTQDSGRGHSMANSSGISEASQEKPYKRSRKWNFEAAFLENLIFNPVCSFFPLFFLMILLLLSDLPIHIARTFCLEIAGGIWEDLTCCNAISTTLIPPRILDEYWCKHLQIYPKFNPHKSSIISNSPNLLTIFFYDRFLSQI